MEKNKKLAIIEINECSFDFAINGALKYKYPKIINFFKKKKSIFTFTNDNKEGLNLDPWVQWVSVHTGLDSKKHQIFRLGQVLSKNIPQIWDDLSKKNFKIGLWGLFNSVLKKKNNIKFFFPDPWSFSQDTHPRNLNSYLLLPRYYALNYPNVSKFKLFSYGLIFFTKVLFSKTIFYLIANLFSFIKIFYYCGLKSFNLYFFLDLISLKIVSNLSRKEKLNFLIFATNSFAHYQHNYWDTPRYDKFYFWYLNEFIKIFEELEDEYNDFIIYNGFNQKKIKSEYAFRSKNINLFFKLLGIDYVKSEQNMTTGVTVFFSDLNNKNDAIKKINKILLHKNFLFDVIDFRLENKIFFKTNLVFYTNQIEKIIRNKKFLKIVNKKKNKDLGSTENKILHGILKNSIFIKSTSKHINTGMIFYSKKNSFNFNGIKIIKNIKVFNLIKNYFS
jgi:hypothetical protein